MALEPLVVVSALRRGAQVVAEADVAIPFRVIEGNHVHVDCANDADGAHE